MQREKWETPGKTRLSHHVEWFTCSGFHMWKFRLAIAVAGCNTRISVYLLVLPIDPDASIPFCCAGIGAAHVAARTT